MIGFSVVQQFQCAAVTCLAGPSAELAAPACMLHRCVAQGVLTDALTNISILHRHTFGEVCVTLCSKLPMGASFVTCAAASRRPAMHHGAACHTPVRQTLPRRLLFRDISSLHTGKPGPLHHASHCA
eukprot:GHUV01034880.1.p2 GENE.GHUV01034880.1~~GHUV01034880.1.p2  ORF type:complete len:127 (-),score=22.51 GHUV01034880.1:1382-1762(-)